MWRGGLFGQSMLWMLLSLGLPRLAVAASVNWVAPEVCPSEDDVRARLKADAGVDLALYPNIGIHGQVSRTPGGFRLQLIVQRAEVSERRRIESEDCGELVDALVAAVALALEGLEPERNPGLASPSSDRVDELPEPEEEARVMVADPQPKAEDPYRFSIETGALVEVGALPAAAFGWEAALGLRRGRFGVHLFSGLAPERRTDLDLGMSGDFSLIFGGTRLCYEPVPEPIGFRGCASAQIGTLRGEGNNVRNPREESVLWAAVGPDVWLMVRPVSYGLRVYLRAGAEVAVLRQPFEIAMVGTVHEPAALGGRFGVGIELEP